MRYLAPTLSFLALAPGLVAQSLMSSPPGLVDKEGDYFASSVGAYANGRIQTLDGEMMGAARSLKGVAYRPDNRNHTTNYGMGRSWSNVSIYAAEADGSKASRTFTANQLAAPTLVFSASASWPTLTGKPAKYPADWAMAFPFSTPYSYSGNNHLSLDFQFAGGTLQNGANWGTGWRYYYLDGVEQGRSNTANSKKLGEYGAYKGCNDRSRTDSRGAELTTTLIHYSANSANGSYRNRLRFYQSGNYFGISAQVVTFLGFGSLKQGFDLGGTTCNKVWVDFSLPTFSFFQSANTSGSLPQLTFGAGSTGIPAQPSAVGLELVTQAYWRDTKTFQGLLSSAASLTVPEQPRFYDRLVLYSSSNTAVTGSGPSDRQDYNPIARFSY